MSKGTYYSHFMQSAFAKKFAKDRKIKYWDVTNNKISSYNIKSKNSKQITSKKNYYSANIEQIRMKEIEDNGIGVISKIINNINNEKIILSGAEINTLQFYLLLHRYRSAKIRRQNSNDINQRKDNFLKFYKNYNEKEIQELMLEKICSLYQEINNIGIFNFIKKYEGKWDKSEKCNWIELKNITQYATFELIEIFNSNISIIKFNCKKLFLSESPVYEKNEDNNGILYFIPINPEIGLCFYMNNYFTIYDKIVDLGKDIIIPKSKIFDNDISKNTNTTFILNEDLKGAKKLYFNKMITENFNANNLNVLFERTESFKYKHLKDMTKISVLYENTTAANKLNRVALESIIHTNEKGLLIFQDLKDLKDTFEYNWYYSQKIETWFYISELYKLQIN